MADNRKIWLDAQGRVLVDTSGKPYYTEECCCVKAEWCWQKFTASCIDAEDKPVYGSEGTGKTAEEHWTEPEFASWTCADEHGSKLPGSVGTWVLDEPGTAHYWKSQGSLCASASSSCMSAGELPPMPDIPCSCTSLGWGAKSVELPNYTYYLPVVTRTLKRFGTTVSSACAPVWDASDWTAEGSTLPSGYSYVFTSRRATAKWYLGDFLHGPHSTAASYAPGSDSTGAITPGYSSWCAASSSAAYYSYPLALYSGSWMKQVGGTAGIYAGYSLYISDVDVVSASVGAAGITYTKVGSAESMSYSSVSACMTLWSAFFSHDQWGSISGIVSTGPNCTLCAVREARGAWCDMQDVPIARTSVHSPDIGGTADLTLEGNPCWHYRTYLVTGKDVPMANISNKLSALYAGSYSSTGLYGAVAVSLLKCDVYYHLYVTEEWPVCSDDPPREFPFTSGAQPVAWPSGSFTCGPVTATTSVVRQGQKYPYPYYAWTSRRYYDSTMWLHEAAETLDSDGNQQAFPGLTSFVSGSYGHAYKVIRLGIQDYPSWYQSAKCSCTLDGSSAEVPQAVFPDQAYYCSVCYDDEGPHLSSGCCWPSGSWSACVSGRLNAYGTDVTTAGYGTPATGYWPEARFMGVADGGYGYCVKSPLSSYLGINSGQSSGGMSYYVYMDDWYASGSGCPMFSYNIGWFHAYSCTGSYLCTSAGVSYWHVVDEGVKYSAGSETDNRFRFTWEGAVEDPGVCGSSTYRTLWVPASDGGSWTSTYWTRTSTLCDGGAFPYQYPASSCGEPRTDYVSEAAASVLYPSMPGRPSDQQDTLVLPSGAVINYTRIYTTSLTELLQSRHVESCSSNATWSGFSGSSVYSMCDSMDYSSTVTSVASGTYAYTLASPVTLVDASHYYVTFTDVSSGSEFDEYEYHGTYVASDIHVGAHMSHFKTTYGSPTQQSRVWSGSDQVSLYMSRGSNAKGSLGFQASMASLTYINWPSSRTISDESNYWTASWSGVHIIGVTSWYDAGGWHSSIVTSPYVYAESDSNGSVPTSLFKLPAAAYTVEYDDRAVHPEHYYGQEVTTVTPITAISVVESVSEPLHARLVCSQSIGAAGWTSYTTSAGISGTHWSSWDVEGTVYRLEEYTITIPQQSAASDEEDDV